MKATARKAPSIVPTTTTSFFLGLTGCEVSTAAESTSRALPTVPARAMFSCCSWASMSVRVVVATFTSRVRRSSCCWVSGSAEICDSSAFFFLVSSEICCARAW